MAEQAFLGECYTKEAFFLAVLAKEKLRVSHQHVLAAQNPAMG